MPVVQITPHLLSFFPALADREIRVLGNTVAEVLQAVEEVAPGFLFYVCDEQNRLRQHVNVFVGPERVKDRTTLSDAVDQDNVVFVIQALSGG
jgi:hypothetical protein